MDFQSNLRPVVAVGAVVVRGGQVLLIQRGHEPAQGIWTLPGGRLELGETLREGLKREIREECGIEIEVGELLGAFERIHRDEREQVSLHYVILDYAARWISGEPSPSSDAADLRWVEPDQIQDSTLRELAQRAVRMLKLEG